MKRLHKIYDITSCDESCDYCHILIKRKKEKNIRVQAYYDNKIFIYNMGFIKYISQLD